MAEEVAEDLNMIQPEPTPDELAFQELLNNPPSQGILGPPTDASEGSANSYVDQLQQEHLQRMSLQAGEADIKLDANRSMFESVEQARARNQSGGVKGLKAIGGGLIQGGLIALEELGYVADLEGLYQRFLGDPEGISGNWWSNLMKDAQDKLRESGAFKIYEDAPNENSLTSQIFKWSSLEGALSSAVGFGLTGLGAAKVVSALGSMKKFKELSQLTDVAMGRIAGGGRLAEATAAGGGMAGATRAFAGPLASSATANYFMGQMMGTDTYNQIMENLESAIENGELTREEAQKRAAVEAQDVVGLNMALVATAYLKFGNIFKRGNRVKGWVENPTAMNQIKQLVKTGSPTAFTENVYQEIIQMEQIYDAGAKGDYSENYWDRMTQLALSNRALHAGALGVIGGPMQFAIIQRPMMGKQLKNQADLFKKQENIKKFHKELIDTHFRTFTELDKISKAALVAGDFRGSTFADDVHTITELSKTVDAGTISILKNDIQNIAKMTEEQALAEGYDSNYQDIARNFLESIERAEYFLQEFGGKANKTDIVQNRLLMDRSLIERKNLYNLTAEKEAALISDVKEALGVDVAYDGKSFKVQRADNRFEGVSATQKAAILRKETAEQQKVDDFIAANDNHREFKKADAEIKRTDKFIGDLQKQFEEISTPEGEQKWLDSQNKAVEDLDTNLDIKEAEDNLGREVSKEVAEESKFRTYADLVKDSPDLTEKELAEIKEEFDAEVDPKFKNNTYESSFTSKDANGHMRVFTPGELVRGHDGRYYRVEGQNKATSGKASLERPVLIETDEKGKALKGTKPVILQEHSLLRDESLLPTEFNGQLSNKYPKDRRWGTYVKTDSLLKPNDLGYNLQLHTRAVNGEVLGINIPAKNFKTENLEWLEPYDHMSLNTPFVEEYDLTFKLRREGDFDVHIDVYRKDGDNEVLLTEVDRNKNINFDAMVEMLTKTNGALEGKAVGHYASRNNLVKHYDQDGNKIYRDFSEMQNMDPKFLINGQLFLAQTQKGDGTFVSKTIARSQDGKVHENTIDVQHPTKGIIPMEIPDMNTGDTYALILAPSGTHIIPVGLSARVLTEIESSRTPGENALHDVVQEWEAAIEIWLKDILANEDQLNEEISAQVENDPNVRQYEGADFDPDVNVSAKQRAFQTRKERILAERRNEEYQNEDHPNTEWAAFEETIFKYIRPNAKKYRALGENNLGDSEYEVNKRGEKVVQESYFKPTVAVSAKTGKFVPAVTIKNPRNSRSYSTINQPLVRKYNLEDHREEFLNIVGSRRKRASIKVLGDTEGGLAKGKEIFQDFMDNEGLVTDIDPVTPFLGSSLTMKIADNDFIAASSEAAVAKYDRLQKRFKKNVFESVEYQEQVSQDNLAEYQERTIEDISNVFDLANDDSVFIPRLSSQATTKQEVIDAFKIYLTTQIPFVNDKDAQPFIKSLDSYAENIPQNLVEDYERLKQDLENSGLASNETAVNDGIASSMLVISDVYKALDDGSLVVGNKYKQASKEDPTGKFTPPEVDKYTKGTLIFHPEHGEATFFTALKDGKYRITPTKTKKNVDVFPADTMLAVGDYRNLYDLNVKIGKAEEGTAQYKSLVNSKRFLEARIERKYGKDIKESEPTQTLAQQGEVSSENILHNYFSDNTDIEVLINAVEDFNSTDRTRDIVANLENFNKIFEITANTGRQLTPSEETAINDIVKSSIPYSQGYLNKLILELDVLMENTKDADKLKDLQTKYTRFKTVGSILDAAARFNASSTAIVDYQTFKFVSQRYKEGDKWVRGEPVLKGLDTDYIRTELEGKVEGNAVGFQMSNMLTHIQRAVIAESQLKAELFKGDVTPVAEKVDTEVEAKPVSTAEPTVRNKVEDKIETTEDQAPTEIAEGYGFLVEQAVQLSVPEAAVTIIREGKATKEAVEEYLDSVEFLQSLESDIGPRTETFVKAHSTLKAGEDVGNTQADFQAEVRAVKKMLPQIPTEVLENVTAMYNKFGAKAIGAYDKGVIHLVNKARAGTVYHEAFHAVSDLYLTADEKLAIAEERGADKWTLDLEEQLADDFAKHVQQRTYKRTNRLVRFFKSILDWFRGRRSIDVTTRIFDKVATGGYANKKSVSWLDNSSPIFDSVEQYKISLSDKNAVLLQELLDSNNIEIVC